MDQTDAINSGVETVVGKFSKAFPDELGFNDLPLDVQTALRQGGGRIIEYIYDNGTDDIREIGENETFPLDRLDDLMEFVASGDAIRTGIKMILDTAEITDEEKVRVLGKVANAENISGFDPLLTEVRSEVFLIKDKNSGAKPDDL